MFFFYIPWEPQKIIFLMFSGGIERGHSPEIGDFLQVTDYHWDDCTQKEFENCKQSDLFWKKSKFGYIKGLGNVFTFN